MEGNQVLSERIRVSSLCLPSDDLLITSTSRGMMAWPLEGPGPYFQSVDGTVKGITFSSEKNAVAVGTEDGRLLIIPLRDIQGGTVTNEGTQCVILPEPLYPVDLVAQRPGECAFVVGSRALNSVYYVQEIRGLFWKSDILRRKSGIRAVSRSYIAYKEGEVLKVGDIASETIRYQGKAQGDVALSGDGWIVRFSLEKDYCLVYNINSGCELRLGPEFVRIRAAAFSPDETALALSFSQSVALSDLRSLRLRGVIECGMEAMRMSFSPSGLHLALADRRQGEARVKVYRLE